MADNAAGNRHMPDVLLSWDRLGFRLLVFGGLALMWMLQGRLAGLSWQDLIRTEVGGLMPWAFLAEIQCLEATGNYVRLHCEGASHLMRSTLSAVEARLDPQRFLRIHRSWIVNLAHVREAQPWTKGGWILLTRRGLKVPVGQQYHDVLSKILR